MTEPALAVALHKSAIQTRHVAQLGHMLAEQRLAGCQHLHVIADYYSCQRKQKTSSDRRKLAALTHYMQYSTTN